MPAKCLQRGLPDEGRPTLSARGTCSGVASQVEQNGNRKSLDGHILTHREGSEFLPLHAGACVLSCEPEPIFPSSCFLSVNLVTTMRKITMSPKWASSDHLVALCGPQLIRQEKGNSSPRHFNLFSNKALSTLQPPTCLADSEWVTLPCSLRPSKTECSAPTSFGFSLEQRQFSQLLPSPHLDSLSLL